VPPLSHAPVPDSSRYTHGANKCIFFTIDTSEIPERGIINMWLVINCSANQQATLDNKYRVSW
jgi:hypothetical protein